MCFIEKMNCIRIRKGEDRVSDLIRTPGQIGYGTRAREPHNPSITKDAIVGIEDPSLGMD